MLICLAKRHLDWKRRIMATTLADLAKELGVSTMTVSRAINNHPAINAKTRGRVLEVARRMNYRPNQFARALSTNRSYLIGLVAPDLMHSYYAEIAIAIEAVGFDGYAPCPPRLEYLRHEREAMVEAGADYDPFWLGIHPA